MSDDFEPDRPAAATDGTDRSARTPAPVRDRRSTSTAELVADLLAATGLVPSDKLALARGRARPTGSLAQALVDEGVASSEGIARIARRAPPAAARRPRRRRASTRAAVEAASRCTCSSASARSRTRSTATSLRVAVADPANVHGDRRAAPRDAATRSSSASRRATTSCIEVRRLVRASEAVGARAVARRGRRAFEAERGRGRTTSRPTTAISDAPLVRLVNSIIFQAAEDGASDIHFEPQEDALVVRFRIDGVLHEVQRIPKRLAPGVTTRLKVLAKLDIAERRKPQDGRISLNAAAAGRMLDIRVATLPTVEGESVVMRLLDKSKKRADARGARPLRRRCSEQLAEIVTRPTGALLVTGPTGSGKSTTLYAGLDADQPARRSTSSPSRTRSSTGSPGINQVQINHRAGLTFAAALRSILRSDPDVVMVGEIRDGETAKISIEAALTGHLVLSTLHTNDAPSALTRLNEMGVEPFLTGSAVTGVLAQRLARKLCTHCCEMYTPSVDELIAARVSPDVAAASDGMALLPQARLPALQPDRLQAAGSASSSCSR